MEIRILLLLLAMILSACSEPKDTVLPKEIEKMESIKPAIEKLSPEERQLLGGYIVRQTIGAKFSGMLGGTKSNGVPDGMTIGTAIEEQRKFQIERSVEEAKQKAVKDKLLVEQTLAEKGMRDAVTVTLVSKKLRTETGRSGIVLDENIEIVFGYKNNTAKNITGVKGRISIRDQFGDELSAFQISNDATIKAGESITWTGGRSVQYALGRNNDRKLIDLADDKYTTQWNPQVIVFADGTKMNLPE
jgi:hypothetical protein